MNLRYLLRNLSSTLAVLHTPYHAHIDLAQLDHFTTAPAVSNLYPKPFLKLELQQ
jgi:hypothetical protein